MAIRSWSSYSDGVTVKTQNALDVEAVITCSALVALHATLLATPMTYAALS